MNEEHEIVQMSYHQNSLLVSSVYRSIMCEVRDGVWTVNQVGKKERKRYVYVFLITNLWILYLSYNELYDTA